MRSNFPRFTGEAINANQPVIDLLKELAAGKKATPAQIALAWVMAQKPWIVPIPGTRSLEHLSENLGAVDVELTTDDLRAIRTALSAITVQGGRMNKEQMAQVDRTN
jgi:aryl-alcohol dehydrogenase-like predicted oxidoreductase